MPPFGPAGDTWVRDQPPRRIAQAAWSGAAARAHVRACASTARCRPAPRRARRRA